MTSRRQTRRLLIALLMAISFLGCHRRREYPNAPILLICPWAAGGGTDRVSRQVAALLERELDVPVNVINATGGAGVTGHTRGALARPDGYTITMVTVEINMLHWRGLTSISYKDYEPVGMLNCDAAALFVRQDAPWRDLKQLEEHVRQNRGELRASGTAQGGIWHLGFAGWLNSVGLSPSDARWISINGSSPSLQELLAGGVDAVCCSLFEAQALLEAGRIRCLGVMSPERLGPFPDVPTFTEQGVDWTLTGWRGICLPKETPTEPRERLAAALAKVAASDDFHTFMSNAGFECSTVMDAMKGLELEPFDSTVREALDEVLPAFAHRDNPVDATPMANTQAYASSLRAILESDAVDCVLISSVPVTPALNNLPKSPEHRENLSGVSSQAALFTEIIQASRKPTVAVIDSGSLYDPLVLALARAGVPVFRKIDRAARSMSRFLNAADAVTNPAD